MGITGLIFKLFYDGKFLNTGLSLEQRGQLGDSFGVINSLFTGLGFGGLVVTLILQQRQMAQQEKEIKIQRQSEERRHYEDTLHRLLSLYSQTLSEVANAKGDLRGRSVLRGSTDRVFEAIKREKSNIIPLEVQERYVKNNYTDEDKQILDYLYFRNFKILTVEIDRQARLVETLKVLLRHLVCELPNHILIDSYRDLVCSQITYIETSYFYLIALTFKSEVELRDLLSKSGLMKKAAHVKRLKVHDFMYEEFWAENIALLKESVELPMSSSRINRAIRAHRKRSNVKQSRNLKSYSSPRTQQTTSEKSRPEIDRALDVSGALGEKLLSENSKSR